MTQPPIKIKLRLNSHQDSKVSTPDSLTPSAPSSPKQSFRSESQVDLPPAKRSRSNRSRKPATPQTANTPTGSGDTPNTANLEDQGKKKKSYNNEKSVVLL
ncbi:hypothetical protein BJ944DRAFT_245299 [Cunninghamella echinulata]|nr:hypothetical protein BJ944DRAFT_245299 [Cunninghamella echinulata]